MDLLAEVIQNFNIHSLLGLRLEQVVIVGGFGNSPHRQQHLIRILESERRMAYPVQIFSSQTKCDSKVSKGAIARAFVQEKMGVLRCSLGVRKTEAFDDAIRSEAESRDDIHGHLGKVQISPYDGEDVVLRSHQLVVSDGEHTLPWMLGKGLLMTRSRKNLFVPARKIGSKA